MGGRRKNAQDIFDEYFYGKQTYAQLAEKYGCSEKTIRRYIDKVNPRRKTDFGMVANVVMDTTYFGKGFGVMVFKNTLDGCVLLTKFVSHETVKGYLDGISEIVSRGISVQSIICDGKKGVVNAFADIPVQTCQFHQIKTVTTYLTRKPKLQASIELRILSLCLTDITKEEFNSRLDRWFEKWKHVLNERTINEETGKSHYTHKKLRSAYRSLVTNLPHLFVFEEWRELDIPNTTNSLDGLFADLKNKLRNHNGLSTSRKKKLIDEFFKA